MFQKFLVEKSIEQFKYTNLLGRMCASNPSARIKSFSLVRKEILSDKFLDIDFKESELYAYREFSGSLYQCISKIEQTTKYVDDLEEIQRGLEDSYKKVMLEEFVPNSPHVIRCFLNGMYYYSNRNMFPVAILKAFVEFFRSCSRAKKNIILSNIQTKLDSIERYDEESIIDDDIPF
jgi:hypothetical protein